MKISEILSEKGDKVVSMRPDETIEMLAHKLRQEDIGAIVVSADGKSLDGIISERDVMRGLTRHGGTILQLKVAQLMTTDRHHMRAGRHGQDGHAAHDPAAYAASAGC